MIKPAEAIVSMPLTGLGDDYTIYYSSGSPDVWAGWPIAKLTEWNANTVRLAFTWSYDAGDNSVYDAAKMDTVLDYLDSVGCQAVLCYFAKGAYYGSTAWVNSWKQVATDFLDDSRILAFQPVNELYGVSTGHNYLSATGPTGGITEHDLNSTNAAMLYLIQQIRNIDPDRAIMYPLVMDIVSSNWNDCHASMVEYGITALPYMYYDITHPYYFETSDDLDVGDPVGTANAYVPRHILPAIADLGASKCWCGETFGFGSKTHDLQVAFLTQMINNLVDNQIGFQIWAYFSPDLTTRQWQEEALTASHYYTQDVVPPQPIVLRPNAAGTFQNFTAYGSSSGTVGKLTVGGSATTWGSTLIGAAVFESSVTGLMTKLSVYVSSNVAAVGMCAIYADNAGTIGSRLAVGSEFVTGISKAWCNSTISYSVVDGVSYWLAITVGGDADTFSCQREVGAANQQCYYAGDDYEFPLSFTADGYEAYDLSIFGTVEGSASDHKSLLNDQSNSTGVRVTASTVLKETENFDDTEHTGTIQGVTVYFEAMASAGSLEALTVLKTHGIYYEGASTVISNTAFTWYSTTYTTNPNTGFSWTITEVNDLESGVRASVLASSIDFSEFYILLDYGDASIIIYQSLCSDSRVNINDNSIVYFKAKFLNDTVCHNGFIYVNGVSCAVNSSGWASRIVSKASVIHEAYQITQVSIGGLTNFTQTAPTRTVIWDAVMLSLSIVQTRVDISSSLYISVNATYAFDGTPITDGTILLNGTAMTFQGGTWWRASVTKPTVGQYVYAVSSVSGNVYDISTFGIISLDGTNDRFTIPHSSAFAFASGFTVAARARPLSSDVDGFLIWHYDVTSTDGFELWQSAEGSGQWVFGVYVGGVYRAVHSNSPPLTGWQDVVGVREDDDTLKMYINGVLQTNTTSLSGAIDSSGSVYIGYCNLFGADYDGYMTEHRFYDRPLQATEVGQLYQSRYTGVAPLALYERPSYDMDDAVWRDLSGNGHDGVIQNVIVELGFGTEETVRPIWDQIAIVFSASNSTPVNGQTVTISWVATRQFDGSSVSSFTLNLNRDGALWHSGMTESSITDQHSSQTCVYSAGAATDNTFGLTAFTTNSKSIVWSTGSVFNPPIVLPPSVTTGGLGDLNLTTFPETLGDALGITTVASGYLCTLILISFFLVPVLYLTRGKNMVLPLFVVGVVTGFCVVIAWVSYWVMLVFVLVIAALWGRRIGDW